MQKWKDIKGFEGLYKINEYGDIYSNYINGIMKPYLSNKGYKLINLYKNNKKYKFTIHKLVAINFIPNPNNLPIVLHLDNNKLNTHYLNLKWGTYSENNSQAIKDGLNKIPIVDNRDYYFITNGKENIPCLGSVEVLNISKYPFGLSGIRNYIYRNKPLKYGPYKNYYIIKPELKPSIIFK